jgi:hypothetical protein
MSTARPVRRSLNSARKFNRTIRLPIYILALAGMFAAANRASATVTITNLTATSFPNAAAFTFDDSNSNIYWDLPGDDSKNAPDPFLSSKVRLQKGGGESPVFTYTDGINNGAETDTADLTSNIGLTLALPANTPELLTIWLGETAEPSTPYLELTADDGSIDVTQSILGNVEVQFDVTSDVAQNLYIDGVAPPSDSAPKDGSNPLFGEYAVALASVPEPTTMSLTGLALLGLLVRPKRAPSVI